MPTAPQGQPSFLVPASPTATPAAPDTSRGLTTGQKLLVYPKGAMQQAIRGFSDRMALKPSSIASVSDWATHPASIAQAFQQSGAHAMQFEELDAVIVNDVRMLDGLSPASVGSGPMPTIGEVHYVYPVSQGTPGGSGPTSPQDLKDVLEKLQQLVQSMQPSSPASAPAGFSGPAAVPAATGGQATWGLSAVKALTSPFTGKGVRVAIIDTGIDLNHPDLKNRIADSTSFVGGTAADDMGHGTHVAGTVAGPRSGALAFGVAPNVQLYIAKVFALGGGGGTDTEVIAAINWAIRNKCMIANMSLSSNMILPPGTRFDPAFEVLAQNALSSNLLLVAAAGNNSGVPASGPFSSRLDPPAPVGHPANCPSVMAVGALQPNLQLALYSNGGQSDPSNGQVDFATPGDDVVSSWPTNLAIPQGQQVPGFATGYALDSGTSMASPHVAGLAALLSEKLGGSGGKVLWQAMPLAPFDPLNGLDRRDVGFGMPQANQS